MTEKPEPEMDLEPKAVAVPMRLGEVEVDMQVATAKRYPRSIKAFKDKSLSMATLDEETAASCFYALPRDGKSIEGPSARLAEIVASSWGNLRAEARTVGEDEKFVYAEAMCWDLETNVAIKYATRRRITNKYGKRYNDDMIATTANAACSIALRNAVFKVVPMAYVRPVFEQARLTAVGDVKTLVSRRDAMVAHFGKMGVQPDRVLNVLGRASVDDIDLDDLLKLKGMATAIKDGELNVDDAFPLVREEEDPNKTRTQNLRDRLAKKSKPAPGDDTQVQAPEPDEPPAREPGEEG